MAHVREHRAEEDEIKTSIGIGEPKLMGQDRPVRGVVRIEQVGVDKVKVGVLRGNSLLAEFDGRLHDIEPVVSAGAGQEWGKLDRHPANTTAHIKHAITRLQAANTGQISEYFLPDCIEIIEKNGI